VPSILVIDDDPLLGEIVRYKLEAVGHKITLLTDSSKALATAIGITPDLIVLDSMMPIMSGPQVLAVLKQEPRTAEIPVIMLTVRKGQDDVVLALRGGAGDYLTKPFMPEELALRISGLLIRRDAAGHARVA
jgi:DNA-binding response OmpR family regulator